MASAYTATPPPALIRCATPEIASKLLPFCRAAKTFDAYLRAHGFQPDDSITFKSGAVITRYRYLGDMLWLATLPDGRACLLPMGMLRSPPLH